VVEGLGVTVGGGGVQVGQDVAVGIAYKVARWTGSMVGSDPGVIGIEVPER